MRLIDKDALMQSLGITDMDCDKCAWYASEWNCCKRGGEFEDACCAIENAPTIEERKTGKWIIKGFPTCSICKGDAPHEWDYCPNCGARMVQEGEDNDN